MRLTVLAAVVFVAAGSVSARQSSRPAAAPGTVPPLSWICPMNGDEEVIEDKPGKCPKCGMTLEAVRLDSVWTCPLHAAVTRERPGKCPIDGRDLVQMTMSVTWVCPGSPGVTTGALEPGTCPGGAPMQRRYLPRPHGNHNPQHGGQFFMAPDNWHHLEGAYVAPGVFRLYLYDDYTKPLPAAQVGATKARVITTGDGKEYPLARNGRLLEARVGKLPFPTAMQAKVKFQPDAPEHHFDFTFESYSKEPTAGAPLTTKAGDARPSASAEATADRRSAEREGRSTGSGRAAESAAPPSAVVAPPAPTVIGSEASGVDPALMPAPIPDTVPEMLAQLRSRNDQIKALIDRGAFASIYVPAFQAKDVALALDAKKSGLPTDRQRSLEPAVHLLVRTAYLLDAFGDIGNKLQISEAYARFAAAVNDIDAAFASHK